MSEFVECQNCGKTYFSENLDCPYCSDTQDVDDLIEEITGKPQPARMVFRKVPLVIALVLMAFVLLFLIPVLRSS
jgi:uncharacterized OB-fold protein